MEKQVWPGFTSITAGPRAGHPRDWLDNVFRKVESRFVAAWTAYIWAREDYLRPVFLHGMGVPGTRAYLERKALSIRVNLYQRTDALRRIYNRIGGWWLGSGRPHFEPRAGGALEGLLWCAIRLSTYIGWCTSKAGPGSSLETGTVGVCLARCRRLSLRDVMPALRQEFEFNRYEFDFPAASPMVSSRSTMIQHECSLEILPATSTEGPSLTRQEQESLLRDCLSADRPKWDGKAVLWFRGEKVLEYKNGRKPATQKDVLDAFEDAGWPLGKGVDIPNLVGKSAYDGQQLLKAACDLNRKIDSMLVETHGPGKWPRPFSFHGDGSGHRLEWRLAEEN